jgi:hypothetical protein
VTPLAPLHQPARPQDDPCVPNVNSHGAPDRKAGPGDMFSGLKEVSDQCPTTLQ